MSCYKQAALWYAYACWANALFYVVCECYVHVEL